MKTVATHEAKTHLSRLLAEIGNGEEYVMTCGPVPVAHVVDHPGELHHSFARHPLSNLRAARIW